jgi:cephalosporin hydroxylase
VVLDSDRATTGTEPGLFSRLVVDLETATVSVVARGDGVWQTEDVYRFDEPAAFEALATAWLRVAWDAKYQWSFSWLGRPVIQLPEDLLRAQEVVYALRPDVILETGVAHGGSLVFYASLCKALGHGRVLGVELPRSPELDHRATIMRHELADYITLVTGDSVDPRVVDAVGLEVGAGESVLLLLDSAHTKAHVLAELEAYTPLVPVGSYAVVQDGFMMRLAAAHRGPRSERDWGWNNPLEAAHEFVARHPGWVIEQPPPPFNEGALDGRGVTHWTGGWLHRVG